MLSRNVLAVLRDRQCRALLQRMRDQFEGHEPSVEPQARNTDWSRDETILLMDLYLSAPRSGKNHSEVVALSAVLRSAAIGNAGLVQASFRNPAGIAMRLRNFGRLDPNALEDRDAGLRPGGTVDRQVWAEFGGKEQLLASEVARVRKAMAERRWQAE